jgi:hypothetical protein
MGERERHDLPRDPEMEARLRSARPQPDPTFVTRLEGELFAGARAARRPNRRRTWSWRPAFAAAFAVTALAAFALALDLVGIGPFGSSDSGQARDDCRTVVVSKRERVPVVHKTRSGGTKVRLEYRRVKRHVKRCH